MKLPIQHVIDEIASLPSDWHGAGSVGVNVLNAISKYASRLGVLKHSVETGSGKTTLLFSHVSDSHLVFAVDAGNSIRQVKNNSLFNSSVVTFVEGPTQLTLPQFKFEHSVQMILLDGPHGYPFPDLEYYYLYQILDEGGVLIVDDINIPSIERMLDILKVDEMYDLLEIVDNTAFLKRTKAPLFNPYHDGWWLQNYNRLFYEKLMHPEK
jgi:hypothetical protein